MSPEQCLGEALDVRSDLYSLGATAFFMFSGRYPFDGKTPTEILAKHVTEPAPQLASIGRSVPRRLASIVDRCLAKDPAHRPADANVVAEQLGVALEQRRELPVALRSFVKRARLNGAGTLTAGTILLPSSIAVSAWFGVTAGWLTFALGALGGPMAYVVHAARRLLLMGFEHADVAPVFKAETEQAREELGGGLAQAESRFERFLRRVAKVSWPAYGASIALFILREMGSILPWLYKTPSWPFAWFYGITGAAAILSLVGLLVVGGRRRDIDTEFWSRFWMGRMGRGAFAIARKLVRSQDRATAMTHRATELSLGMAADQLFQSLPKATRDALGNFPEVLRSLQDNAQALRERSDRLQEALNYAGDASSSPEYADVRATRDHVRAKLGEVVAALETIRLNLLRLHAGSATVEGLTTHLHLAAEMSEDVGRLISAQGQVERYLIPSAATPTPA